MISKRAQLGATLTWMVAFTIIFFVMLLFLLGVSTLAVGGKAFNAGIEYDVESEVISLRGQRKLVVLLNSEVDFLGEKMFFKEAITKSVNIYTKSEVFSKLNIQDLSRLKDIDRNARGNVIVSVFPGNEGMDAFSLSVDREKAIRDILKEKLEDECYAYYFESPLFGISFMGGIIENRYDEFRKYTFDRDITKSSIIFTEGNMAFEVKMYVGKYIHGDCDEK